MYQLTKAGLYLAAFLLLWSITPDAQAQRRGGYRGYGVQIGPSGVYVGPTYGRYGSGYYDGRSYGGRYYDNRYGYGDRYWYGNRTWPRTYYYSTPQTWYPATTETFVAEPVTTARIHVQVDDPNAEVWFNGVATQQRGMNRVFDTPPLSQGYTISGLTGCCSEVQGSQTIDTPGLMPPVTCVPNFIPSVIDQIPCD